MASGSGEETVHKQTIKIEALKTRSVTLYPSGAAIVRDIEDVIIKPGRNEITILGFSLHADQNTIKVEGHGTDALITDMVVEQTPRKSIDPEVSEPDFGEVKSPELYSIREEIDNIQQEIEDAEEIVKSCTNQVTYIEQHILGLSTAGTRVNLPVDMDTKEVVENLQYYGKFRAKVYQDYKMAQRSLKKLRVAMTSKRWEEGIIWGACRDLGRQALGEKRKQEGGFPQWVKQVTITIESNSLPENTRSIVSIIPTGRPAKPEDDEPPVKSNGPSLRVSYIVSGASWKPRYDLRLDTTSEIGVLTYRAELLNHTGETWRDATVTLATSQTSFTGLEDKAPWMDSWRLSLRKIGGTLETGWDELYSPKEKQMKLRGQNAEESKGVQQNLGVPASTQKASGGLFRSGFGTSNTPTAGPFGAASASAGQVQSGTRPFGNNISFSGGLFGNNQSSGSGLFANTNNAPSGPSLPGNNPPPGSGLFGNNPSSGGGLFANTNNAPSGPSLPGNNPPSSGGLFGNNPSSGGGLFANTSNAPSGPSLPGNNSPSGGGLFGNNRPSGGGLFANINNAPSGPSLPGNSGGGLFGNNPLPGGSLFGNKPSSGGGLFGNNPPSGGGLFGSNPPSGGGLFGSNPPSGGGLFGSNPPSGGGLLGNNPPSGGGLFGNNPPSGGGLFGNYPPPGYGLFANNNAPPLQAQATGFSQPTAGDSYDSDASDDSNSGATLNPPGKMGLALSSSQSYGLTTTYDLPGARTIPSSGFSRRHVITEISLPDIKFSHIAIPKLRAAVFLKARIRNSSSTLLLRGPVGLTLDGSFLGNSTIGRCAPEETFELGLGIDEEVIVEYRKPVRKMGSQGILAKEQVATFERGIGLYNAHNKAVKLLLFDQVPISEDEKLKITILNPRGLRNVGDVVKINGTVQECGVSAKSSTKERKDTKEVSVELRKDGEIRYQISLEKGQEAFLPLEYEAKLPVGEAVFGF